MLASDVGVSLVVVHGGRLEVHLEVHDVMAVDLQVQEELTSSLVELIWTWRTGGSQSGPEPEPRDPWEAVVETPSGSWWVDSFHAVPRVHVSRVDRERDLAANFRRYESSEPSEAEDERRGNVDGGWRRCWTDGPHSATGHYSACPDGIRAEETRNDRQDHSPWVDGTRLEDAEIVLYLSEIAALFCLWERVMEDLCHVGMARFYHGKETQEPDGFERLETPISCQLWDHSGDWLRPLSCLARREMNLLSVSLEQEAWL